MNLRSSSQQLNTRQKPLYVTQKHNQVTTLQSSAASITTLKSQLQKAQQSAPKHESKLDSIKLEVNGSWQEAQDYVVMDVGL